MKDLFERKGFTLIETLAVLFILAILSTIVFYSFSNFESGQILGKETNSVLSYLERARSESLSSLNSSPYGIYFNATSTTIFMGASYSAGSSPNEVYTLNPSVTISSISLTGGVQQLYFNQVTGIPSATGTITLSLSEATSTKTVTIYETGLFQSN